MEQAKNHPLNQPGPGELQSVLVFVVTLHLINQLAPLTNLTGLLGSQQGADFKVKTKSSRPSSSPGPGLETPADPAALQDQG